MAIEIVEAEEGKYMWLVCDVCGAEWQWPSDLAEVALEKRDPCPFCAEGADGAAPSA